MRDASAGLCSLCARSRDAASSRSIHGRVAGREPALGVECGRVEVVHAIFCPRTLLDAPATGDESSLKIFTTLQIGLIPALELSSTLPSSRWAILSWSQRRCTWKVNNKMTKKAAPCTGV
jgi:hypothetical protein